MKKSLLLKLDVELYEALVRLAADENRSVSNCIVTLLFRAVEEWEKEKAVAENGVRT